MRLSTKKRLKGKKGRWGVDNNKKVSFLLYRLTHFWLVVPEILTYIYKVQSLERPLQLGLIVMYPVLFIAIRFMTVPSSA